MSNKDMKIGICLHYVTDLLSTIQGVCNAGYHFIIINLIHPRSREFTPYCDLTLASTDWSTLVVAYLSNYDFQTDPLENAIKMEKELTYAMHLGLPALLFKCPSKFSGITHLARILNSKIVSNGSYQNIPQFWIEIPINSADDRSRVWRNDIDSEGENEDTWFRWDYFRSLISPDKRVSIALDLSGDLPDENILQRWSGEPVKAIILPTSIFLSNKKGYPVLSKAHQIFIRILIDKMARDVHFIIKGNKRHDDLRYYSQYIEHIKNTQVVHDPVAAFAKGYEDYLQIPLQPLQDNLESCTYEVFEKDPVKYEEYGKAILEALTTIDRDGEIIIMVVGAGRGPLVYACLQASEKCKKYVHVYAVEKNPNAVVTLQTLRHDQWGGETGLSYGRVEVIPCDMRDWCAPDKADMVVSELLGSFGDNELSPECLDGVWSYVKQGAISIPQSYTSYLAPIQSQRLYCEAAILREKDKPPSAQFETGYVVHMRNCYLIHNPLPLFTFDHSDLTLDPKYKDNSRFKTLNFTSTIDTVCHGFAGYFETVLFNNIKLSTVPSTHTTGMFSWFPIYFPIHSPMPVKKGHSIQVHFWRLTNKRQIWYEWSITSPSVTLIHNPNGRSYSIGLS